MSSINTISVEKLARLVGTPEVPGAHRRPHRRGFRRRSAADPGRDPPLAMPTSPTGRASFAGRPAIVVCQKGQKLSQGVAAWLRHAGVAGRSARRRLRGLGGRPGCRWCPAAKLPPRDAQGRTVWVTRARPKIDRIACPWLIRRFVDPRAVFLFVAPSEVAGGRRALRRDAVRHRGRVLEPSRRALHLRRHGRGVRPRDASRSHRLATIVRGADTARLDLAPEAAGPARGLARPVAHVSPTTSRSSRPGCCSTTPSIAGAATPPSETHNWPTNKAEAHELTTRHQPTRRPTIAGARRHLRRGVRGLGCASRC